MQASIRNNMTEESNNNSKYHPLETPFTFRKHMIIRREFKWLLKQNRLDDFETVMKFADGEIVKRQIKERSTVRFHIPDGKGKTLLYLKRYRYPLISSFLKNCVKFSKTYSAIHEWRNILAFHDHNLPTMVPVAVGMRSRIPFVKESFLLTLGISDTETLEKTAEEYFRPPLDETRRKQKRMLINKVALLAQHMHEQGFRHQDFYLCHILINWKHRDNPLLFIVDLHRVTRERKNRTRWRIKDLAALNYSAPAHTVSRTDRLRFLKQYSPRLAGNRSFIKAIVKKTQKIRNHNEKRR